MAWAVDLVARKARSVAQSDRHTHTFLPLLEKRICSAPPSEASNIRVDYYRSFEAQKMVFGPALIDTNFKLFSMVTLSCPV